MHFEVYKKTTTRADHRNSVTTPKQYPCLELVHNYDWEDSDIYDWFHLWYCQSGAEPISLGDVKIMTRQEVTTMKAFEAMGQTFEELDDSFCSLGLKLEYYRHIGEHFFRQDRDLIMRALRDCAANKIIYEDFRYENEFNLSLWRELSSQDAFKYGALMLNGRKLENAYSFGFTCKVPSAENEITLRVNFPYECQNYQRTIGIIGENGMGKTQLLSRLSESIVKGSDAYFQDSRMPLFDACVVLCSTPYDSYRTTIPDAQKLYLYKSLEQRDDHLVDILTGEIVHITKRRERVRMKPLYGLYLSTLSENIGGDIEKIVRWIPAEGETEDGHYEVNIDALDQAVKQLSSGQLHLFLLITYLFRHIHYSSLIIIDEPEVHLHPHTIVVFMRVLARILNLFNSYSIIATHSPLIVREMISANVQVLRKVEDGLLMLNPVAYNTFGEDITTLYYNIFNYDIKDSVFASVIDERIRAGKSYDNIIKELEPDVDLSLNARLTIRDLIEESKNSKDEAF